MSLRRLILQSGLFSITLHLAIIAMLVISFDFLPRPKIQLTPPGEDVVKAVAVDNEQVEQELQRIKELENEKLRKQQELEQKLKELENRAAQAEKQRKEEEKRLAQAKQEQEQEKKQRELEQKKLGQLKKEQQELEQKRKLEEDRKKAEQAEQKRKEEDEALKRQRAEEQRRREAQQASQDQKLLGNIATNIYRRVAGNFNKSGLPSGLECELTVRTVPGGEVINVSISRSSGNEVFDRRAMAAVEKASPLPLPGDAATFDRLKLRQIAFTFRPED